MIKKNLKMILCFTMFAFFICNIVSCDSSQTTTESVYNTGGKTLKLWHIWAADTETQKKPFEKILNDYLALNPDVNLEIDAVENEAYKIKIKTAMAVDEEPDVFFTWGAGFAKPFIRSGNVLDIDEYAKNESISSKVIPGTLDNFIYDGKVYASPMYMWAAILYCNEELFQKADVKIPDTYDELIEAVKVFNSLKITPIITGQKERWPGMFFQNILAVRTAGVGASNRALSKEAPFNTPEFVESAAKLEELVKLKAFDRGVMALTKDEAEADFKMGRAAMYYMGSWAAESWDAEGSSIKGKVVCKNFPAIRGEKGDQRAFLGGSIETFMVSANTQYKSEAVELARYICENMSKQALDYGFGIPTWKEPIDNSKLSPINSQILDLVSNSTGFVIAWDTFLEGSDANTHKNLVAKIFAKCITPQQFAEEMQKLNEVD